MDLKLRQYEQGKAFCDGVVARARDRGAQPRLERARGDADGGRAGDPAGWLRRTEPPQLRNVRVANLRSYPHKVGAGLRPVHVLARAA